MSTSAPTSSRPGLLHAASVLIPIGLFATGLLAQESMPEGLEATITIRVNGGDELEIPVAATTSLTGATAFVGALEDPDGLWKATWNYTVDLNPEGNAAVNGNMIMHNLGPAVADYEVIARFPLCPVIDVGTMVGGNISITLTMNEGGGQITTQSGDAVLTILSDDGPAAMQFHGPFQMGSSGAGSAMTNSMYGMPAPALAAPAMTDGAGMRYKYQVTSGDKVNVSTMLVIGGNPDNFVACEEGSGGGGGGGGPELELASGGATVVDPVNGEGDGSTGGESSTPVDGKGKTKGGVVRHADKGAKGGKGVGTSGRRTLTVTGSGFATGGKGSLRVGGSGATGNGGSNGGDLTKDSRYPDA